MPRVCLIGLDSLAPELLFARYWAELPHLAALSDGGVRAVLHSCEPPITVPAWMAMLTGQDPGAMGVYGFADRADYGYHRRVLASSRSLAVPPLWHHLGAAGLRSRLVAIPQTYPPQPLRGALLTGLLTPPDVGIVTYPAHLAAEARAHLGGSSVDVAAFRDVAPARLVRAVRRNTRGLFALARHWAAAGDWSFLMLVDMGADRLQHALWRHCVPDHPRYAPQGHDAGALRGYYRLLDAEIGRLLRALRPDDVVMVASDHGAQPMHGGLALNEWLIDMGYLRLVRRPAGPPTALDAAAVDWPRTRAWADGGYVGRIHLNIAGREPQGALPAAAAEATLDRIEAGLAALPHGPHRCIRPARVFPVCRGVPPAMWVHAGALRLRCLGSVGHRAHFVAENDRGPDGANHSPTGIFLRRAGATAHSRPDAVSIYDVAPTVLHHLGLPAPPAWRGRAIV